MNRLSILILLLGAFASLAVAASAPTFCKCTCFTNSTIIEIKPKSSKGGSSSNPPAQHQPPSSGGGSSSPADPEDGDDHEAAGDGDSDSEDQDALLLSLDLEDAASDAAEMMMKRSGSQQQQQHHRRQHKPARRAKGSSSSPSCSQCNRSFCLSQSLPICKGAADKDVSTMCFQRDSRKDQVIVWGFILGTAGLLGWAGLQKVVDARSRGGGIPGIGGGRGRAGAGGGPPRGRREGGAGAGAGSGGILPLGRAGLGSTGTDGGRGAYAAVAGHSRESSLQTS